MCVLNMNCFKTVPILQLPILLNLSYFLYNEYPTTFPYEPQIGGLSSSGYVDSVFDSLDVEATSLRFTFDSGSTEMGANGIVVIACHAEGRNFLKNF